MTTFREYVAATRNAGQAMSRPVPMPAGARQIQGERAGFASRFIGAFIDFLLIFLIVLGTAAVLWMLSFIVNPVTASTPDIGSEADRIPSVLALVLYGYFLNWIYWSICWATSGRTVGNLIMGIRVVNIHGNRLGIWLAMVRSAFCTLLPIGLAWVIVSHTNRSIQDAALRTSVIYDWVIGLPTLSELFRRAHTIPTPAPAWSDSADQ